MRTVDGGRWTVDKARHREALGRSAALHDSADRMSDEGRSRDAGPRPPSTVNRQLVVAAILVTLAMLLPTVTHACPVCYGDPNSPMTKGTSNAIWFLLGIVGFVQAGFIALFVSFRRRARALQKFKEQFHVVH